MGVFHISCAHTHDHPKTKCYFCKIFCTGFDELNLLYVEHNLFSHYNPIGFVSLSNITLKTLFSLDHHQNRAPPSI